MRVAVTGGSGFLGGYVIENLLKNNYIPIIITRSKLGMSKCEYRITDYTEESLIEILSDVDAVVHLAAKRGSQERIYEFHKDEIITQNLYNTCYKLGIRNIVYASSISVYSGDDLLPWSEEQLPAPTSMYGISKLTNEYIGNLYSTKKGLCIKNLRFAHLFGFNEKNNYMINRFMRQAYHRQKLVVIGKSIAKREFLYAKDAAKAILYSLRKPDLSGTFNIGSGEAFTNYEVAEIINKVFGNEGNIILENPNGDEGIQSSFMDSSKACEVLGYSPDYSFSSALEEIYTLLRGMDNVPLWY